MKTEELNQIVYVVKDGAIEEVDLRYMLVEYGQDCTTTPNGVAPREFIKNTGKFELWSWGVNSNNPKLMAIYDTEVEAEMSLYDSWHYNLKHNDHAPIFFFEKQEALNFVDGM